MDYFLFDKLFRPLAKRLGQHLMLHRLWSILSSLGVVAVQENSLPMLVEVVEVRVVF